MANTHNILFNPSAPGQSVNLNFVQYTDLEVNHGGGRNGNTPSYALTFLLDGTGAKSVKWQFYSLNELNYVLRDLGSPLLEPPRVAQ